MNFVRNALFIAAVIVFFLIFFILKNQNINFSKLTNAVDSSSNEMDKVETATVSTGKISLTLEVADTPDTREKGLSYRKDIGEFDGMLFVFPEESYQTFWMKDMNFDLDIVWLNDKGEVVQVNKNVKASNYNKKNPNLSEKIPSQTPILYVLELPAGKSKELEIKVGTIFRISN
jgi:uncharacterized membrane protein (UPF0127 family)